MLNFFNTYKMSSQLNLKLSGRIGIQEVAETTSKVASVPDCTAVDLKLYDVNSLDISCIQLIIGLREKFGNAFHLQVDTISPELKTLLFNTGVYEIINDSSN